MDVNVMERADPIWTLNVMERGDPVWASVSPGWVTPYGH